MALEVKPGDEVITTPYSFFATAGCIVRLGAIPVFVDIDGMFNIDAARVGAAVTSRTRGIMPVHLFGQMADMGPIMDLATRLGLWVVEDAAQALGAEWEGRRAGLGERGLFQLFPPRTGCFVDGGAVTLDDADLAATLDILRNHGARQVSPPASWGQLQAGCSTGGRAACQAPHLERGPRAPENAAPLPATVRGGGAGAPMPQYSRDPGTQIARGSRGTSDFAVEGPGRRPSTTVCHPCPRPATACRPIPRDNIGCEVYYPLPLTPSGLCRS